jgi:hypothetical protein
MMGRSYPFIWPEAQYWVVRTFMFEGFHVVEIGRRRTDEKYTFNLEIVLSEID